MLKPPQFSEEVKPIIDWIDKYLNNIEDYPVRSQVKPREVFNSIPDQMPAKSQSIASIMEDLDEKIIPGVTHWQHPNFHAYFPCGSSLESIFAEMLMATMGVQGMIWETSPAAAELEEKMLDWLKAAMNLPTSWKGVIQDSASSSTLVAILTAREVKTNFEANKKGVPNNLRIYCSEEVHSSIEKGAKIAGIGSDNVVKIKVDQNMAIIPAELEKAVNNDLAHGLKPCCVVAGFGTTGTMGMDNIRALGEICQKHDIWYHVDAAYAGTALLLPEYHWMIDGIDLADSFVFNPHKWMFTNFDCSCYYVKDTAVLKKTFEITPEYLKTNTEEHINNYRDWGIPLGRRFRSLKLWFVMRGYGLEGLQAKLRNDIALNTEFVNKLKQRNDFEIVVKPIFNMTCFRYKPEGFDNLEELNQLNKAIKDHINDTGQAYITHTIVNGKYTLRFLPAATYIEKRHVDDFYELLVTTILVVH